MFTRARTISTEQAKCKITVKTFSAKIGKWQREFEKEVEDEEEMEDCRMGSTREERKVESKEETDEVQLLVEKG